MNNKVKKICLTGLMAALITVCTAISVINKKQLPDKKLFWISVFYIDIEYLTNIIIVV